MLLEAEQLLKKHYGYDEFRKGQKEILGKVFSHKNTMGVMPTGGGKSICYQIPSLVFDGVTLVISPLISLMKDQVDELHEAGIDATFINSSLGYEEVRERIQGIQQGTYPLVYVAPERLESASFSHLLQSLPIALVAVDEAHCLSQWGHDFRPSYLRIPELIEQIASSPAVLALTATATPEVTKDICKSLSIHSDDVVQTGFARKNLSFHVMKGVDRDVYIKDYLKRNPSHSGIIYAATRKEVERLHDRLHQQGVAVGKYHGGLSTDDRRRMQEEFVYDQTQVMVATNAFGMGINKSNVRFVIHAQMPRNIESYYQEAGRAGRDGEDSACILLFSAQDIRIQQFLIDQSSMEDDRKANEYAKLQAMVNFCHTENCLQAYILAYFKDTNIKPCGRCSECVDDRETVDVTKEAQMVFSCIKRMGERFGKTMVAQVLVGSANQKVKDFSFQKLTTYGLLKNRTQKDVSQFIDYLVASQYLALTSGNFPVLQLTENVVPVLKGEVNVVKKQAIQPKQIQKSDPLFEKLRELRRQLAKTHEVAPYMVFSDQTLNELCSKLPETEAEMLEVKGVGQTKLDTYGKPFLTTISVYLKESPKQQAVQQTKKADGIGLEKDETPSFIKTYELYKEGRTLEEIEQLRAIKKTTVQSHLLQAADEDYDVNFDSLIDVAQLPLIEEVVDRIGLEDGLKPLKDALPEEVDYFTIKAFVNDYLARK
ncbi:DNA helicase RecQ [Salipaludibacillus sp. CF4.18]|uniref:DNA helicase RecQ n=1 Tax=Salipaludibacillus sp. CF4.18 TaxID=3373081 RepID=UPI003EE68457